LIEKLWLYPPIAISRVGPSPSPCDSFNWGPSDLSPRGTGKTTLYPTTTLHIEDDGNIVSHIPEKIDFKDSVGWKPVCPFFELHGEWEDDGKIFFWADYSGCLEQIWKNLA